MVSLNFIEFSKSFVTYVHSLLIKIKKELEALERIKEEESKKFKSHDIHFDFNILTLIKELMVDVSSSCMELALKVALVLILQ